MPTFARVPLARALSMRAFLIISLKQKTVLALTMPFNAG